MKPQKKSQQPQNSLIGKNNIRTGDPSPLGFKEEKQMWFRKFTV